MAILTLRKEINLTSALGKGIDHLLLTTKLYKSQLYTAKSLFPLENSKLITAISQYFKASRLPPDNLLPSMAIGLILVTCT
jgi:hypothetical protein